jgi:hypothetical protein
MRNRSSRMVLHCFPPPDPNWPPTRPSQPCRVSRLRSLALLETAAPVGYGPGGLWRDPRCADDGHPSLLWPAKSPHVEGSSRQSRRPSIWSESSWASGRIRAGMARQSWRRVGMHRELHRSGRAGWLRPAVLGANDGIVSTASLVIGVAAAAASRNAVLLAGVAGLVGGATSMAAGEYVSVSSQRDAERADSSRELAADPESELTEVYIRRGWIGTWPRRSPSGCWRSTRSTAMSATSLAWGPACWRGRCRQRSSRR